MEQVRLRGSYFERLGRMNDFLELWADGCWYVDAVEDKGGRESVVIVEKGTRGMVRLSPELKVDPLRRMADWELQTYEGPMGSATEEVGRVQPKMAVQLIALMLQTVASIQEVAQRNYLHYFVPIEDQNRKLAAALKREMGYVEVEAGLFVGRVNRTMKERIFQFLGRNEVAYSAGLLVVRQFQEFESRVIGESL